jgi:hypothetical protein
MTALCATPEGGEIAVAVPDEAKLWVMLVDLPPMTGWEYFTANVLAKLLGGTRCRHLSAIYPVIGKQVIIYAVANCMRDLQSQLPCRTLGLLLSRFILFSSFGLLEFASNLALSWSSIILGGSPNG